MVTRPNAPKTRFMVLVLPELCAVPVKEPKSETRAALEVSVMFWFCVSAGIVKVQVLPPSTTTVMPDESIQAS